MEITLWGSPLWQPYRLLYRAMTTYPADATLKVAHRHHGFRAADDPVVFTCAELIEAATQLGARARALDWFTSRGRDGIQPPAALAKQLGLAPVSFSRMYEAGRGRAVVNVALRASRARGFAESLVITATDKVYEGDFSRDDVLAWARAVEGHGAVDRPVREPA